MRAIVIFLVILAVFASAAIDSTAQVETKPTAAPITSVSLEQLPTLAPIAQEATPIPATVVAVVQVTPPVENSLQDFAASLINGNSTQVVGVYFHDQLNFVVLQQEGGDLNSVRSGPGIITQFQKPLHAGVNAFLAHNTNNEAGSDFKMLLPEMVGYLIYGDGHVVSFTIESIDGYKALSPNSTTSDFQKIKNFSNMTVSSEVLSHNQVYTLQYTNPAKVVFQTCLWWDGNYTWGRIFVTGRLQ